MAVETKKLRWLIAIRLVVITSVAVVHVLRGAVARERGLAYEPFLYADHRRHLRALPGLPRPAALAARPPGVQAAVQLVGDISIVTGLVYYFGGAASSVLDALPGGHHRRRHAAVAARGDRARQPGLDCSTPR